MMENEQLNEMEHIFRNSRLVSDNFTESGLSMTYVEILAMFEEIQQYRAIGAVEEIKEILQIISEGQDDVDESGISTGLLHTLLEYAEYAKIGTVEECREAREKQRAKKPIMKPFYEDMEEEYLCCPNCGDILTDRIPMDNKDFYFHCLNCGQKFDWSDTK